MEQPTNMVEAKPPPPSESGPPGSSDAGVLQPPASGSDPAPPAPPAATAAGAAAAAARSDSEAPPRTDAVVPIDSVEIYSKRTKILASMYVIPAIQPSSHIVAPRSLPSLCSCHSLHGVRLQHEIAPGTEAERAHGVAQKAATNGSAPRGGALSRFDVLGKPLHALLAVHM